MDCRTARHLLDFSRPHVAELAREDQDLLDRHLAVCPDCDTQARSERQIDEHLSRAVRNVPVPQGLRERLLQRLAEERDAWYRRWLARVLRVTAAAAAVLLIAWFGFLGWRQHHLPPLPSASTLAHDTVTLTGRLDQNGVEAWFKEALGARVVAPADFDYQNLLAPSLEEFRGEKVPALTFVRVESRDRSAQIAHVFILSDRQFDLGAVETLREPYEGDKFRAQVWRPTPGYVYSIIYTGNLDDMLVPRKDRPHG
jgi:hypothetical protein